MNVEATEKTTDRDNSRIAPFGAFHNISDEQLDDRIASLWTGYKRNRLALGEALSIKKERLAKRGCDGEWSSFLKLKEIPRTSADRLVNGYRTCISTSPALRNAAEKAGVDPTRPTVAREIAACQSDMLEMCSEPSNAQMVVWVEKLKKAGKRRGNSGSGEQELAAAETISEGSGQGDESSAGADEETIPEVAEDPAEFSRDNLPDSTETPTHDGAEADGDSYKTEVCGDLQTGQNYNLGGKLNRIVLRFKSLHECNEYRALVALASQELGTGGEPTKTVLAVLRRFVAESQYQQPLTMNAAA